MIQDMAVNVVTIIYFQMLVYVRFTFFGLIFLFNALMWTVFVKSLQTCSSSLEATVTNTAANFFFTVSICNSTMGVDYAWLFLHG